MMFKINKNDQGQFELWYQGENSLSLLGVYETEEELERAKKSVQKQEERAQFQSHTLKDGKRRKVVLRDPGIEESESPTIKTVIISDNIAQVGNLDTKEIDLLISLGDLPDYSLIHASQVYQPIQFLAVRGNHDDAQPFTKPILDLHLQVTEFKGITFGGFAGSWKYKPEGSHLYTQEQASRLLDQFPPVDIFLAHNSPWGVHESDHDIHQGFQALWHYIERVQPRYFFHGHQHVNKSTQIGKTQVMGVYGEKLIEIEVIPTS